MSCLNGISQQKTLFLIRWLDLKLMCVKFFFKRGTTVVENFLYELIHQQRALFKKGYEQYEEYICLRLIKMEIIKLWKMIRKNVLLIARFKFVIFMAYYLGLCEQKHVQSMNVKPIL